MSHSVQEEVSPTSITSNDQTSEDVVLNTDGTDGHAYAGQPPYSLSPLLSLHCGQLIYEKKRSDEVFELHSGSNEHLEIEPASIPLPESRASSQVLPDGSQIYDLDTNRVTTIPRSFSTPYFRSVASLAHILPHLKIVINKDGTLNWNSGSLSVINFSNDASSSSDINRYPIRDLNLEELGKIMRETVLDTTRKHVFVADDLSPMVIEILGREFKLSPEVFAEHLSRCSYGIRGSFRDEPPNEWSTRTMPRKYVSLRWWRPIHRAAFRYGEQCLAHSLESRSATWERSVNTPQGEGKERFSIKPSINIIRSEWPSSGLTANLSKALAWEERATLYCISDDCMILLLDPLLVLELERDGVVEETWCPWNNVCPRSCPPVSLDGNFEEADLQERLRTFVSSTRSTSEDFLSWFNLKATRDDIGEALLRVVQIDTNRLLDMITASLDKMSKETMDEALLQDHLPLWRSSMSRYMLELPKVRKSLTEFADFLANSGMSTQTAKAMLRNSILDIEKTMELVEKSYNTLRTEMSILDSRRSIAEAESVSKLTELAFIFIPITFVASAFSMQIQELQEAAPLYAFFAASVGSIVVSYSLRLFVRSQLLSDSKNAFFSKVREHGDIPPNRPVTTRSFVMFLFSDRNPLRFVLVVGIVSIPIIVPFWIKSHLETGFKIVMTVLIVITVTGTSYFMYSEEETSVLTNIASAIAKRRLRERRTRRATPSSESDDV